MAAVRRMSWLEWKYWNTLRRVSIKLDAYLRRHKPLELRHRVAIRNTGMYWVWEDTGEVFKRG